MSHRATKRQGGTSNAHRPARAGALEGRACESSHVTLRKTPHHGDINESVVTRGPRAGDGVEHREGV